MIRIVGELQEIGADDGLYAGIYQPGTKRQLQIYGLTVAECRELGKHLYEDVVITVGALADTSTASQEK